MNKNTVRHHKFTLIELLVVITIIAITTEKCVESPKNTFLSNGFRFIFTVKVERLEKADFLFIVTPVVLVL